MYEIHENTDLLNIGIHVYMDLFSLYEGQGYWPFGWGIVRTTRLLLRPAITIARSLYLRRRTNSKEGAP